MLLFASSFVSSTTSYCYQETTNSSNAADNCIAGTYNYTGWYDVNFTTNPSYTYDGLWNTYGTNSSGSDIASFISVYRIPTKATNGTIIIKDSNSTKNIYLDNDNCIPLSFNKTDFETTIELTARYGGSQGNNITYYYECSYGPRIGRTYWRSDAISFITTQNNLYEEAFNWTIECVSSFSNTTWSNWTNYGSCIGNIRNQSRNLTTYDTEGCVGNTTVIEYNATESILANTTFGDWTNITTCYDYSLTQERNKTQYDTLDLGCYINTTFSETQTAYCDSKVDKQSSIWLKLLAGILCIALLCVTLVLMKFFFYDKAMEGNINMKQVFYDLVCVLAVLLFGIAVINSITGGVLLG